jgi:MarR family 2-MHQ and catechol resistance regulon transcriptional repressor
MHKSAKTIPRKQLIEQVFLYLATLGRGICFKREMLFKEDGLSIAQTELIFQLFIEGPLSMSQLAEKMFITKGALSQLVKSLEEKTIVEKHNSREDNRVSHVSLSRNAEARIRRMHEDQYAHMKHIFNDFSDEDIGTLATYLHNLKSNIYENYEQNHTPNRCNR